MCHAIEKVYKMAMGTFPKSENFAQKLENLINQTSLLTGRDVGMEKYSNFNSVDTSHSHRKPQPIAPVTYIKVVENPVVSIGIFIIREGQQIPLHDHPHMHGIIKCIQGHLRISAFSKKDTSINDLDESLRTEKLRRKIEAGEIFLTEKHVPIQLNPESRSCCLQPNTGNLHKVESVNGQAAFIDILSPPYNVDPLPDQPDQQVRECNYYRDTGELQISTGLRWMLMTPPPPSFHCDTEQYQGPGHFN